MGRLLFSGRASPRRPFLIKTMLIALQRRASEVHSIPTPHSSDARDQDDTGKQWSGVLGPEVRKNVTRRRFCHAPPVTFCSDLLDDAARPPARVRPCD
jgi:hypothetical protein